MREQRAFCTGNDVDKVRRRVLIDYEEATPHGVTGYAPSQENP